MRETKADVIDGAMNGEKEAQAQLLEEARATVCAVALCRVCLDGKLQAPVCAVSIKRRMPRLRTSRKARFVSTAAVSYLRTEDGDALVTGLSGSLTSCINCEGEQRGQLPQYLR